MFGLDILYNWKPL